MRPPPGKKETLLALLERTSVFVHLDPRREGVMVPSWFKAQPQLVLQVGLNLPVPIHDLAVEDDAVSCTLSFNRAPFHCVLPWKSVYALVGEDGRSMVWPGDVPREVITGATDGPARPAPRIEAVKSEAPGAIAPAPSAAAAAAGAEPARKVARKAGGTRKKAKPKAPAVAEQRAAGPSTAHGEGGKRPLPPYLRVVK